MTSPDSVASKATAKRCGTGLGSGSATPMSRAHRQPPAGLAWVEVHTENYMADGGPRLRQLELIRERYALSFHGVGLSLGSADPPDAEHLGRIRRLVDRFAPALLSEHIAWSIEGGHYLNDLFPIPYTEEALAVVARNMAIAQEALGRRLMVENPSSYLRFVDSTMPECQFVAEIAPPGRLRHPPRRQQHSRQRAQSRLRRRQTISRPSRPPPSASFTSPATDQRDRRPTRS